MDDSHHLCQKAEKAEHQRCKWKNAGIFISENPGTQKTFTIYNKKK